MTSLRRAVERSEAFFGDGVDLGAAIEQQRNTAQMAIESRNDERRVAVHDARLDVSVIVEQQRSNIDVTFTNSTMQCSAAVVVGGVDVGAVRNQSFDFVEFAADCRQHERRHAVLVAFVEIRIALRDFDFLGCCRVVCKTVHVKSIATKKKKFYAPAPPEIVALSACSRLHEDNELLSLFATRLFRIICLKRNGRDGKKKKPKTKENRTAQKKKFDLQQENRATQPAS